jgi:hypothetical protein
MDCQKEVQWRPEPPPNNAFRRQARPRSKFNPYFIPSTLTNAIMLRRFVADGVAWRSRKKSVTSSGRVIRQEITYR